MAGLQGCWEYYAHRCCQNEHSLLSQFTLWLEIEENCLRVIRFVICLFSHHTMKIVALTLVSLVLWHQKKGQKC